MQKRKYILIVLIGVIVHMMISCSSEKAICNPIPVDNNVSISEVIIETSLMEEDILSLADQYQSDINQIPLRKVDEICHIKYLRKKDDYVYTILKNDFYYMILFFDSYNVGFRLSHLFRLNNYLEESSFKYLVPYVNTLNDVKLIDPSANYIRGQSQGSSLTSFHYTFDGKKVDIHYGFDEIIHSIDYSNTVTMLSKDISFFKEWTGTEKY